MKGKFQPYLKSFLFTLCFLSSCRERHLDFGSGTYFGVKQVLFSENCQARCGEKAGCEGFAIRVAGFADPGNLNSADRQFYLLDAQDPLYRLEVKMPERIAAEVFEKLWGSPGTRVRVTGVMQGYDAPRNFSCRRQYILHISDASQLDVRQ